LAQFPEKAEKWQRKIVFSPIQMQQGTSHHLVSVVLQIDMDRRQLLRIITPTALAFHDYF
jgi:hypothetical protein